MRRARGKGWWWSVLGAAILAAVAGFFSLYYVSQQPGLPRGSAPGPGPQNVPGLEPDIAFGAAEWRLDEYGISARVIPVPGHTPGSVAVLLDSGEAIVGDIVMRMFGRNPKPGRPFVAWDLARNEESVRRLAALNPHPVYAGHGGPFTSL